MLDDARASISSRRSNEGVGGRETIEMAGWMDGWEAGAVLLLQLLLCCQAAVWSAALWFDSPRRRSLE